MHVEKAAVRYLTEKYSPEAIITYGSFAEGTANAYSDFDALVIAPGERRHDASVVAGTVLDVFLYPPETFQSSYDPEAFIQIYDGKIIMDSRGTARELKECVRNYVAQRPRKTEAELQQERDWCSKMRLRTTRGDAEGNYRWHWLLTESLEIYFDLMGKYYFGPKKSLKVMEQTDPDGFRLYAAALREYAPEALNAWVDHLLAAGAEKGKI